MVYNIYHPWLVVKLSTSNLPGPIITNDGTKKNYASQNEASHFVSIVYSNYQLFVYLLAEMYKKNLKILHFANLKK